MKARNHSWVASALPHSEGNAYKPQCGEIALCPSQRRPDAALVIADPFLAHERALLAKLMVEHRLPSISAYHECAVARPATMTSSVAVRGNACFEWFRRFLAELWRETKHPFMSDPDQVVDQDKPDRRIVVTALGVTQILAWGSTFYLLGVLANPIVRDTGWDYDWVISGVSAGLLMAGVVSPRVGRAIGKWGGRRALALSTVLLAAGLLLLGASRSIPWYLAAWLLVGAGMGSGLTDAAFSTLGSIYGDDARSPITSLTLFAGFASTVCWPLSAYLVEHLGWRGACFCYAAIQIGVALPILLLALPRHSFIAPPRDDDEGARSYARLAPGELSIFALLAVVLTLSAAILSMVGVHLLPLLQARGLELSAAVGLGAIVGPSQVGARIVEMLAGRRYHPIWTMVASAVLVAIGTELLYADFPAYSVAIVLYGAGNGLGSVARGTLALAQFGSSRYPMLMGRLALPILMSMALSPFLGAIAFEAGGANLTLGLIAFLGAANVLLVGLLWTLSTRRPTSG